MPLPWRSKTERSVCFFSLYMKPILGIENILSPLCCSSLRWKYVSTEAFSNMILSGSLSAALLEITKLIGPVDFIVFRLPSTLIIATRVNPVEPQLRHSHNTLLDPDGAVKKLKCFYKAMSALCSFLVAQTTCWICSASEKCLTFSLSIHLSPGGKIFKRGF